MSILLPKGTKVLRIPCQQHRSDLLRESQDITGINLHRHFSFGTKAVPTRTVSSTIVYRTFKAWPLTITAASVSRNPPVEAFELSELRPRDDNRRVPAGYVILKSENHPHRLRSGRVPSREGLCPSGPQSTQLRRFRESITAGRQHRRHAIDHPRLLPCPA